MDTPTAPDPGFPRLTTAPFPAYRFVPGVHPHPRNDPRGHSYGRHEADFADEALAVRSNWRAGPRFCYSVDLYNHAYWWEAHEGWEGIWRCYEPDDPLRFALQVFIQVSAAHLQRHMGHPDGAGRLLKHARLHLDAARSAGPVVFGCNVEAWWRGAVVPYFAGKSGVAYPFLRPQ